MNQVIRPQAINEIQRKPVTINFNPSAREISETSSPIKPPRFEQVQLNSSSKELVQQ